MVRQAESAPPIPLRNIFFLSPTILIMKCRMDIYWSSTSSSSSSFLGFLVATSTYVYLNHDQVHLGSPLVRFKLGWWAAGFLFSIWRLHMSWALSFNLIFWRIASNFVALYIYIYTFKQNIHLNDSPPQVINWSFMLKYYFVVMCVYVAHLESVILWGREYVLVNEIFLSVLRNQIMLWWYTRFACHGGTQKTHEELLTKIEKNDNCKN